MKQLGLAIGIPFGLVALVIVLVSGISRDTLGAALILWAAGSLALGYFGEPATAVVTHIRREGGERTDAVPGHYTSNISYTFTLSNGKKVDGFTKRVGDAIYLKVDGTGRIAVRYFKIMPYMNAPEENTPFSLKQRKRNALILKGPAVPSSMLEHDRSLFCST